METVLQMAADLLEGQGSRANVLVVTIELL